MLRQIMNHFEEKRLAERREDLLLRRGELCGQITEMQHEIGFIDKEMLEISEKLMRLNTGV